MSKKNVAITGLGFVTSIGNDAKSVADSLISLKNGIERYKPFDDPKIPAKCVGTVKISTPKAATPKTGHIRPNTACVAMSCAGSPRTACTPTAQWSRLYATPASLPKKFQTS